MAYFEVKQSSKLQLTSYSGLALIGQCCQAAQVEAVIDPKIPVSQGMRTSHGASSPSRHLPDMISLPAFTWRSPGSPAASGTG